MTTEELRRWAVETAMRCWPDIDPVDLAQRLVDFVAPPGEAPAVMPADFGRRIGEAGACSNQLGSLADGALRSAHPAESFIRREVSRDAMDEREAIVQWLERRGACSTASLVRRGNHHE